MTRKGHERKGEARKGTEMKWDERKADSIRKAGIFLLEERSADALLITYPALDSAWRYLLNSTIIRTFYNNILPKIIPHPLRSG